jgi:hypothetical protein
MRRGRRPVVCTPTSPGRLGSRRLRRAGRAARSGEPERAGTDTTPGGEPLLCVREPTRGIYCIAITALNRLEQAAPENDPAYGIHPGLLLANTVDSRLADELPRPWVIRGSRLFNSCFGCNRAVSKVAGSLCHAPKRLPSRRRLVPLVPGVVGVPLRCISNK